MINGINSSTTTASVATYTSNYAKTSESVDTSSESSGVVYEQRTKAYASDNSALIEQLKADTQNRISQMQSLVTSMFEKQGIKIASTDDMWKALANGNFTADADTIAQAKKDIAEDGYWGVKQTSERIFDFAVSLSGGDEETMQKMKEAVEKGFGEATKAWGKELPSISSDTYDAVMKKFDEFFNKEVTE